MSAINSQNPIRVLHCPDNIGGNPQQLAQAERELGLQSLALAFFSHQFGYKIDETLFDDQIRQPWMEIKRLRLVWRALKEFDIVHFNFGQSIMRDWVPADGIRPASFGRRLIYLYEKLFELRDLPLLKKAGKGIVVTYQGDDARQADYCLTNFEFCIAKEAGPEYYPPGSDEHKRRRIATFARYADRIYALNPDLLYMLPSGTRFQPYANVNPREWQPISDEHPITNVPIILHAPSNRDAKGTRFILAAIDALTAEGVPLEFILVEGVSHSEARRLYERADLLIDQVLCGWYGGLAVELMALGKPVVCYIRQPDLQFVSPQMAQEIPIISATPETLVHVLREWLTVRKHELPSRGRASRAYVERWHDPIKIAAELKKEYEAILASKRHTHGECLTESR